MTLPPLSLFPRAAARLGAACAVGIALVAAPLPATAQIAPPVGTVAPQDATAQEATGLIRRASRLFAQGKKDEAVFWFYAGQLRARAYLAAHPDLDPSSAPAPFGALMESVGHPVNEYAFGDISALIGTIDRVLVWDEANPTPTLPAAARQSSRAGLVSLRDQIRTEAASIRAERAAKGLENR